MLKFEHEIAFQFRYSLISFRAQPLAEDLSREWRKYVARVVNMFLATTEKKQCHYIILGKKSLELQQADLTKTRKGVKELFHQAEPLIRSLQVPTSQATSEKNMPTYLLN